MTMPKTIIITDTDSSLSVEKAAEFGILQVPIGINFGEETFISGENIDDESLFQMIDSRNQLPTTSAPNPESFASFFETAFAQGADSIVCITVSSQVSSTYDSALKAKASFPDRDIHVIDSYNLSVGQGFMVLAAAEAAAQNASVSEIITKVNDTGKNLHTFAILSTLKYLYMGGRVTKLEATLADSFEIRPTLTVKDGKLAIFKKNRTQKRALNQLVEHLHKTTKDKTIERMAVIHVNELSGALALKDILKDNLACPETIDVMPLTPGLSVHTGSGLIGVVFQTK